MSIHSCRKFLGSMSNFGPRSRATPHGALYGDVEAASRDSQCVSSGGSPDGVAQPYSAHGGNGVSGGTGAADHGGNGSHHPGGPSGGLAEWGRRHGGGVDAGGRAGSGGSGSDDGQGLLDWQPDEPDGPQQQGARRPWWQGASTGVALMCLLLTMGSFLVPESEQGVGMVMKHIRSTSANAKVGSCCPPHSRQSLCKHAQLQTSVTQHRMLAPCGKMLHLMLLAGRCRAPRQGVCCPAAGRAPLPAAPAAAAQERHREGKAPGTQLRVVVQCMGTASLLT
jgi:hypothetical protein